MTEREPRSQYSVQQFIDAIPKTGGIISTIAARIGCDWHTARKYIDNHPTIKQVYLDECERVTDLAESQLIAAINNGDMQAVKFYLTTKGKKRGYVERQEVTGADGDALTIRIVDVTDG